MATDKTQYMLDDIERELMLTAPITGIDRLDPRVLEVMASVPRDAFVPEELRAYAYDNRPLPIGHEQTISQPFIVALMTHLLGPRTNHHILEIGTGSGYQTAILSRLATKIYSIDRVPELAEAARTILSGLKYENIENIVGDGYRGWPEHAPYDGIIVTAAASYIPPALMDQLKPGARLVIPVGSPFHRQELMLVEKDQSGELHSHDILPVAFVPMQEDAAPTTQH